MQFDQISISALKTLIWYKLVELEGTGFQVVGVYEAVGICDTQENHAL
jgi:hypothetical protein